MVNTMVKSNYLKINPIISIYNVFVRWKGFFPCTRYPEYVYETHFYIQDVSHYSSNMCISFTEQNILLIIDIRGNLLRRIDANTGVESS